MSDLLSWLWEHITEVSLLLGGIGTLAGYYFSHWKAELADPASLEKLRPYLDDSPWRTTYRRTLDRALDAANRFFGPPISWRAFGVCLTIAFFYPTAFFLLTWVLGGPHTLGAQPVLPNGWPPITRIVLFSGIILYGASIFGLLKYRHKFDTWIEGAMTRTLPDWKTGWRRGLVSTGVGLLAGSTTYGITGDVFLAFGIAVFGAGTLAPNSAFGIAVGAALVFSSTVGLEKSLSVVVSFTAVVTVAFVAALRIARNVTVHKAFVSPGAFASLSGLAFVIIVYLGEGEAGAVNPQTMPYFFFFFGLPLLNAALDTGSWAVSRWLGREMLDRNFHRWGMIGFAFLDFVVAFLFLSMLAVLLGAAGESIDQFAFATTGSHVLNLGAIIRQATMDPFGNGLWITLMLFSTLVPTAIHAFVAIGSTIQLRGQAAMRKQWREEADEALAENEGLDPHTCRKIAEHWLLDRWLPSVILLLVLFVAGWFAWQASVLPDALLAAVEWGRSLVG